MFQTQIQSGCSNDYMLYETGNKSGLAVNVIRRVSTQGMTRTSLVDFDTAMYPTISLIMDS